MKRAVIIGATSGIGREVAKQLLLQGCTSVLQGAGFRHSKLCRAAHRTA